MWWLQIITYLFAWLSLATPVPDLSVDDAELSSHWFFPLCLFFMAYHLWRKNIGGKNPHPSGSALKSWRFWSLAWAGRKTRGKFPWNVKMTLKRIQNTSLGQSLPPWWICGIIPHSQQLQDETEAPADCTRLGWWFPPWLDHKTPLVHGVKQMALYAGQWRAVCLSFFQLGCPQCLYQDTLAGYCTSPLLASPASRMAGQIWTVSWDPLVFLQDQIQMLEYLIKDLSLTDFCLFPVSFGFLYILATRSICWLGEVILKHIKSPWLTEMMTYILIMPRVHWVLAGPLLCASRSLAKGPRDSTSSTIIVQPVATSYERLLNTWNGASPNCDVLQV